MSTLLTAFDLYPGLRTAEVRHTEDNRYLLLSGGRVFQIGAAVFEMVQYLQRGLDLEAACTTYEQQHLRRVPRDEMAAVLSTYLSTDALAPAASRTSYIYGQVQLLKGSVLTYLGRPFQGLFHPLVLAPLLALVAALLVGFVLKQGWFMPRFHSGAAVQTTLLAYVGVIVGIFFHELGHSVGALRYGMHPKGIGFGFYLIFPVFFADVTDVWSLTKSQRIVINLGGVYFQGLFSLILIGLYYALPAAWAGSHELLGTIVTMNLFVMIYSLNPFLRNDGYWIYSDLFGIPNLMHQAVLYPLRFVPRAGAPVAPLRRAELPLLLYAAANYALFVYLLRVFINYSSHTLLPRLAGLLSAADFPGNLLTWPNGLFLLKTFGLYGFMLYMTVFTFWRNYRNFTRNRAIPAEKTRQPAPLAAAA
jgi:putative peptide zinc metalloprotease protein